MSDGTVCLDVYPRKDTAPTTPRRRVGTAAIAQIQQRCFPTGWRRSRGWWTSPTASCSSTSSTCRAWASSWSRSGLILQPAGLSSRTLFQSSVVSTGSLTNPTMYSSSLQHCPGSCCHAQLHVFRRKNVFLLREAQERGQSKGWCSTQSYHKFLFGSSLGFPFIGFWIYFYFYLILLLILFYSSALP